MIIKISAGLVAAGLLYFLPTQVYAANSGALELLEQGYGECKSAQLYRRKDFDKAREIYGQYVELKRRALEKDSTLADGSDPGVARILEYCERVGSDIGRVEAMPIFMRGLEACKVAGTHMMAKNLNKVQESYQTYVGYRDQAVQISESVMEVPSLAPDLQRCERVQSYLEAESSRISDTNDRVLTSITHLRKVQALCNSANSSKRTDPDWFESQYEEVLGMDSSVPNQSVLKELPSGSNEAKTVAGLRASVAACEKRLVATIGEKKRLKVVAEQANQQTARQLAEDLRRKELSVQKARQQQELAVREAARLRALAAQEARQRKELEAEDAARRKAWEDEDRQRRERLAREETERSKAWEAEEKRRRDALAAEEDKKRKEIAAVDERQRQQLAAEKNLRLQALVEKERSAKALADQEEQIRRLEEENRLRRQTEPQQGSESVPDSQSRLIANAAYYNLVRQTRPNIPRDMLPPGTSGYVIIEYFINTKGRVVNPVVVESQPTPALGKLTLQAVEKWRYRPDFKGREKEEAFVRAQINFASQN